MVTFGNLKVDRSEHKICGPLGAQHAPNQQIILLDALARGRGRIVSLDHLVGALYPNPADEPGDAVKVVRVQITYLRRAMALTGCDVRIAPVWKAGYRLEVSN